MIYNLRNLETDEIIKWNNRKINEIKEEEKRNKEKEFDVHKISHFDSLKILFEWELRMPLEMSRSLLDKVSTYLRP